MLHGMYIKKVTVKLTELYKKIRLVPRSTRTPSRVTKTRQLVLYG